ncbi:CgeB family protein [Rhodopila sp.]|uniref:CgeB family protein n=1 Tax=Rhodopila sp. TaxID=2480087 RepID=UPI002C359139|nr:glycosyltransferase [Rhodopila sp.]HVZ07487.1 glycosyltransferase [Rhodopila sp.]
MHVVLYTHSLVSDWNHGNAHFLRGVLTELQARGHTTLALEPADGWSRTNLRAAQGDAAIERFAARFPDLRIQTYGTAFDHERALDGADLVIVHEWTAPELVAWLGVLRRRGHFTLLFHDTHHRAVSASETLATLPLEDYDGVLAFGDTLRQRYEHQGWGRRVFTWHEAADTRVFWPRRQDVAPDGLIWIGNWGDGERAEELDTFLIAPARSLGLVGRVHGVRYPVTALDQLNETRLRYAGWIANADVPEAFAQFRMTVHIPRRPYVHALPGIPTIRIFEALACGIPLISAPWNDAEGLFIPGEDFLFARDGAEMTRHLAALRADDDLARALRRNGLTRIRSRHSCAHRVDELLAILDRLDRPVPGSRDAMEATA